MTSSSLPAAALPSQLNADDITRRTQQAQQRLLQNYQTRIAELRGVLEKSRSGPASAVSSAPPPSSSEAKALRHPVRAALQAVRELRNDALAIGVILSATGTGAGGTASAGGAGAGASAGAGATKHFA